MDDNRFPLSAVLELLTVKVTMTATFLGRGDDGDWRDVTSWRCVVYATDPRTGTRRQMTVPFRQGSAHTKAPTLDTVLSCILADARDFAYNPDLTCGEWMADLGYTDLAQGKRACRACFREWQQLQRVFPPQDLAALLEADTD